MNIISKNIMIKIVIKVISIILIAKIISLSLEWYLPESGVNFNKKVSYMPQYKRYSIDSLITPKKVKPVEHVTQVVSSTPISDMILTGIYKTTSGGYIIVSLKKERDSSIISIGEVFNGYKLIEIETKRAIFEKNSKRYVVNMLDSDVKLPNVTTAKLNNDGSKKSSAAAASKRVSKKDIAYYAKNFNDIWKDIGIKETKENGKITGFEVTKIRDKSSFAELGLLKGDVIIKANNVELHSYADALSIYKNINKLDALELVVLRDNQEVEIIYEVN